MSLLLIDNYDSFTFNLVHQLKKCLPKAIEVLVRRNDEVDLVGIHTLKPRAIVISPGPGNPSTAGNSLPIVQEFHRKIPILGVCLGHQILAQVFGYTVRRAFEARHGKVSQVFHSNDSYFMNIPSPFLAARYHSLSVYGSSNELTACAHTEDGTIMALRHNELPIFGVQFHPESFLTEYGDVIIRNFLTEIGL